MPVGRHHAVVDLPLTPGRLGWPGKDDGGSVEPADHELGVGLGDAATGHEDEK